MARWKTRRLMRTALTLGLCMAAGGVVLAVAALWLVDSGVEPGPPGSTDSPGSPSSGGAGITHDDHRAHQPRADWEYPLAGRFTAGISVHPGSELRGTDLSGLRASWNSSSTAPAFSGDGGLLFLHEPGDGPMNASAVAAYRLPSLELAWRHRYPEGGPAGGSGHGVRWAPIGKSPMVEFSRDRSRLMYMTPAGEFSVLDTSDGRMLSRFRLPDPPRAERASGTDVVSCMACFDSDGVRLMLVWGVFNSGSSASIPSGGKEPHWRGFSGAVDATAGRLLWSTPVAFGDSPGGILKSSPVRPHFANYNLLASTHGVTDITIHDSGTGVPVPVELPVWPVPDVELPLRITQEGRPPFGRAKSATRLGPGIVDFRFAADGRLAVIRRRMVKLPPPVPPPGSVPEWPGKTILPPQRVWPVHEWQLLHAEFDGQKYTAKAVTQSAWQFGSLYHGDDHSPILGDEAQPDHRPMAATDPDKPDQLTVASPANGETLTFTLSHPRPLHLDRPGFIDCHGCRRWTAFPVHPSEFPVTLPRKPDTALEIVSNTDGRQLAVIHSAVPGGRISVIAVSPCGRWVLTFCEVWGRDSGLAPVLWEIP